MTPFLILPAIDLKGGRCVRLRQGRAEDETVYAADPVEVARRWVAEGAEYLHVVDLDGAFAGRPAHLAHLARIAASVAVPVQFGGGLRTDDDLARVLDAGAARAIVGTRALGAPAEIARLAARHGPRLAVGIDARDGRVQVRGWTETTDVAATDLARRMADCGVATLIHTDTSRDGMLAGVAAAATAAVCRAAACRVVASGGVTSPADVRALRALGCPNLEGAIVGKALYEGAVALDALRRAAAGGEGPAA